MRASLGEKIMTTTSASRSVSGHPDEQFIRDAIDKANLNALRLALYQVTGDPDLPDMGVVRQAIRGGALYGYVLAPDDHAALKAKAFDYLSSGPHTASAIPDRDQARRMMEMFAGEPISDDDFAFGYEELAYEQFPRDVRWTTKPAPEALAAIRVVVVGGGISGIAAAVQLQRLGIPYVVIERQSALGGTWMRNSYPEARVDTSSFLYQFKFEKNYPWAEFFASRDDTRAYLDHVATKYGVKDSFQFDSEVVAARWEEGDTAWILTVNRKDGTQDRLRADYVISASGLFNAANMPDIAGIGDFEGPMFHTSAWDHGVDYRNKRVALIGTGSTGTQLAPGLASAVENLTIYQRTANWMTAMENYRAPVSDHARWLFDTMPFYWNWYCYASFFTAQQLQGLQTYDHDWRAKGGQINERNDLVRSNLLNYICEKLGDRPDLVAKVTPDHAPLVRRLVVDNGFYDALRRDNVELVTDPIERITPRGILNRDGTERSFDLIVLGAGFRVTDYLWPVDYVGRNGATLSEAWKTDGARAYLGIAMPGFPNLFVFYGPNGQPRSGGFYSWAEIWSRYVVGSIVEMIEGGHRSIEVRRDVFDAYNARMDEATRELIWEEEGHSYYVNSQGRSAVNMPWTTSDYHAMVRAPNLGDYHLG